jgi:hypothetical protein
MADARDFQDPIVRLAQLRIIKLSADLEVQLAGKPGASIAIEILTRFRMDAAVSLSGMAFLNLDDPADFIKAKVLQNEVKRYDELFASMLKIVIEGKQYDAAMETEAREEMLDALSQTNDGVKEAIALGLIEPQSDD